jgi:xanthine dehydrogenase YagS FAD-binding subunit
MQSFAYARAASVADALAAGATGRTAFLAGGTELLNWLRLGVSAPQRVLDISRLEGLDTIEPSAGGGVRIGALAKLNDVAQHERTRC